MELTYPQHDGLAAWYSPVAALPPAPRTPRPRLVAVTDPHRHRGEAGSSREAGGGGGHTARAIKGSPSGLPKGEAPTPSLCC